MSTNEQITFQIYLSMVWISYILRYKQLGPNGGGFIVGLVPQWRRYCKKCQNFKPPRTHHCKTCNQCVLQMDHHCPWTMNCVGHGNLPHFLRFLIWVIFTCGYLFIQLCKRIFQYYEESDLPIYLISKREMVAVIFLTPIDFLVFASLVILFIRCIINTVFRGMTQIEVWEWERIESQFYTERLWSQIRHNYFKLHGKELPKLSTWTTTRVRDLPEEEEEEEHLQPQQDEDRDSQELSSSVIVPQNFTIDDLIFPYDLGIWRNTIQSFGYPWMWLLPLAGPNSNGVHPEKSQEYIEDDQLNLPWPPDGGHQEITIRNQPISDEELLERYRHDIPGLKKYLDPRSTMRRNEWMNDLGETLDDFGVDLEAEDSENEELLIRTSE
ncbi:PFA4 [[Candida] subhashii]|uniref:Palmitoyltransferase n=1 Tax=[Candida] subhashii TaxID=561895 RepID=A0A8J5R2L2_9ASCO|nr:PFA4 [[Candida] subhashii]KAG7664915.1 PFA4 [[Candida] subhashii]